MSQSSTFAISHDGRTVAVGAVELGTLTDGVLLVLQVSNNAEIADLSRPQPGYWSAFAFSPDERTFYDVRSAPGATSTLLERVDLEGQPRSAPVTRPLPDYTTLVGFSRGCPVLWNQLTGAYRSCDACDEQPIPAAYSPITMGAVVSSDGAFVLASDPDPALTVTLWSLPPHQRALRAFDPPVDDVHPVAIPYAVSNGGQRALVGAFWNYSCYSGHSFTVDVRDGATGDVLDQLPPQPTSMGGDLSRIAYGARIWCGR